MPCLVVKTNATLTAEQKRKATDDLSKIISETTGKPVHYIMVLIEDNVTMRFGGSEDKCIYMEFRSIGCIDRASNKKHSKAFSEYFAKNFGFDTSRIYINFENKNGSDWGYDAGTFG